MAQTYRLKQLEKNSSQVGFKTGSNGSGVRIYRIEQQRETW